MQKILILGGCGFVGSALVKSLLGKGYELDVIDNQWFGKNLTDHPKLRVIKKDIRNLSDSDFKYRDYGTLIHF